MKTEMTLTESGFRKSIAPLSYATFRDSDGVLSSTVVLLPNKNQFDVKNSKEVKITVEIIDSTNSENGA